MKNKDMFQTLLLGGTILVLLLTLFTSCSKDEPEKTKKKTLTIDLTDLQFSSLKCCKGSYIIDSIGIIVAQYDQTNNQYYAAACICPNCSSSIAFVTNNADPAIWRCSGCQSDFDEDGVVLKGPSQVRLKTYPAVRNGNLITITY